MARLKILFYMVVASILAVAFVTVFYGSNLNFSRFFKDFSYWMLPAFFAAAISSQIFYSFICSRISAGKPIFLIAATSVLFSHLLMGAFGLLQYCFRDFFDHGYVNSPHDGYILSWLGFSLMTVIFGGVFTFPLGVCAVHLFALTSRSSGPRDAAA